MEQSEITERNEQIANMLGFVQKSYVINPKPEDLLWCDNKHGLPVGELKFDSDWNWLMEACNFMKYKGYNVIIGGEVCSFYAGGINHILRTDGISTIQTVFILVSDFAKIYNDNEGKL